MERTAGQARGPQRAQDLEPQAPCATAAPLPQQQRELQRWISGASSSRPGSAAVRPCTPAALTVQVRGPRVGVANARPARPGLRPQCALRLGFFTPRRPRPGAWLQAVLLPMHGTATARPACT